MHTERASAQRTTTYIHHNNIIFTTKITSSSQYTEPQLHGNKIKAPKLQEIVAMNKITGPDPAVMEAINRGNVVCFFDIEMGEPDKSTPLGRIKMELFVKDVSA